MRMGLWAIVLQIMLASIAAEDVPYIGVFVVTQPYPWHEHRAQTLIDSIKEQNSPRIAILAFHTSTKGKFEASYGDWTIWVALTRLHGELEQKGSAPAWLLVLDESTQLSLKNLVRFAASQDASEPAYFGHGLFDKDASVIHHYAFIHDPTAFKFPDTAGGLLFSWPLIQRLVSQMSAGKKAHDFTIDPKHELAMQIWEDGKGVALSERNDLFCTLPSQRDSPDCVTVYAPPIPRADCGARIPLDQIFFAVKTYHGNHKDRVVVVKRTWAHDVKLIEYYSDQEDRYIPTIDLGINNTERGHCAKTLGILRGFLESVDYGGVPWLVVADDDTLFSVPRLAALLACYDPRVPLILGERYAYGFSVHGDGGYEYPTGGPSMVFSRAAVAALLEGDECRCPQIDSPDDMILGMCARNKELPILHSDAFHQARPEDYADDYLARIAPISFHKHWNTDPYKIYTDRLKVNESEEQLDELKEEL